MLFLIVTTVYAGDCQNPYFKSILCGDLNYSFLNSKNVIPYLDTIQPSVSLDWNGGLVQRYVWTKTNNTKYVFPQDTNEYSTDGRLYLGSTGTGDVMDLFDPEVVLDENETDQNARYKMWYVGNDGTNYRIFMAISPDGLTWKKVNNAIPSTCDADENCSYGTIGLGTNGKGDDIHTFAPNVLIDGNIFKMWYAGYTGVNWRIYYATSLDRGFTWSKYNNAVLEINDNYGTEGRIPLGSDGRGDDAGTHSPAVVKLDDGSYVMIYSGNDGTRDRMYKATSLNGLDWEKTLNVLAVDCSYICNITIGQGVSGAGDDEYARRADIVEFDGIYYMLYAGQDGTNFEQYMAYSYDLTNWTKVNNAKPVNSNETGNWGRIPLGLSLSGDSSNVNDSTIVYDGNKLIAWYSGADPAGEYRIYRAEQELPNYDPTLAAYFKFENLNSLNYYDELGFSTGTLIGNAQIKANSFLDTNSLVTTNSNQRSSVSHNSFWHLADKNFTIEFWFNAPNGYNSLGSCIAGIFSNEQVGIYFTNGGCGGAIGGDLVFYFGGAYARYPAEYTLTGWRHLAAVREGQEIKLYIDGNLIDSATINPEIADVASLKTRIAGYYDDSTIRNFTGSIDEFQLYHRAKTQEEIIQDYNKVKNFEFSSKTNSILTSDVLLGWDSFKLNSDLNFYEKNNQICGPMDSNCEVDIDLNRNLIGLWHLNGDTLDSSINNITATRSGVTSSSGLWKTAAYSFDGSNDYLSIPDNSLFDFEDKNFTVGLWVNLRKIGTAWTGNLINKWNTSGTPGTNEWSIGLGDSATGLIMIPSFSIESGNTIYNIKSTENINNGLWYHIVGKREGDYIYIFVNGEEKGKTYVGNVSVNNVGRNIYIGRAVSGYYYNGLIEEISIWDRALSNQEISNLSKGLEKNYSRIDMNFYTCEDINCLIKNDFQYIQDVNENVFVDLNLNYSNYLGYDLFFKINEDYDISDTLAYSRNFSDIEVQTSFANIPPTGTINSIGGEVFLTNPVFSDIHDGNLTLDFNVFDLQNDDILLTIRYSPNQISGDGIIVVEDVNLREGGYCDSNNWNINQANCQIDLNTYQFIDGSYYLKLDLNDSIAGKGYVISSNIFSVDNSPPILSGIYPSTWKRGASEISINCSDQTACSTIQYKINNGIWQNYSNAFTISGDGNYQIDFNAIDTKGNISDINTFFVPIGFDGKLFTYNDKNKPETFFSQGEIIQFIYDVNLGYTPTITIIDSSNNVLIDANLMTNISNDQTFGSDLNTYYFEFVVDGDIGWIDVNIENQFFESAFYNMEIWDDAFTDSNGNVFPFVFDINVNEPNTIKRWNYPVDINISFTYPVNPSSLRVLDYNGSTYRELPSQLYGHSNSGLVSDSNLVFLVSIDKNESKQFFVNYSVVYDDKNYDSSLTSSTNPGIDINNNFYSLNLDSNQGGGIIKIKIKDWDKF